MSLTLNYGLFSNAELLSFCQTSLQITDESTLQTLALLPFIQKGKQDLEIYEQVYEKNQKSQFTDLLAEKDAIRDESFLAFRSSVEAASHSKNADIRNSAEKILEVIRRHGWSAASFGYKASTAAFSSIVAEINTSFSSDLALINCTPFLAELYADEKEFEKTFKNSISTTSADEPTLTDTRRNLVNSIKGLFSMIVLLQATQPSSELAKYEQDLSQLIIQSLATVKAANTRTSNAKKAEEAKKNSETKDK